MLASVASATVLGVRGSAVTVEVHVANGLPGFTIVGLPDESCREARDRVRAAVLSSGLSWPQQRITVNLAPTSMRKVGSGLDLAVAVAVLAAAGVVPPEATRGHAFIGELGLDGSLRTVPAMVPMAAAVSDLVLVVPAAAGPEAAVVARGPVRCATDLVSVVAALRGEAPWGAPAACVVEAAPVDPPDMADVRGHAVARLAVEVAAAGFHHLLMVGPPGSGKTLLATRLVGLLPPLDPTTALEVTMAHSAVGFIGGLRTHPPLRAPHHGATSVSLVGGGSAAMRPGEVALAHGGVLFLDELAEFGPSVLDGLRQPLESGVIRVDRARGSVEFPARFLLVAAMNPCPCGSGDRPGSCRCNESVLDRYRRRVSGPLIDRFDLRLVVSRPAVDELLTGPPGESSAVIRLRVERARAKAAERSVVANALLPAPRLDELAPISAESRRLLRQELTAGRLSARGLHRVRRVARTVADLCDVGDVVDADSMQMALRLRSDVLGLERAAA
jgi:magnesium chelatase family protein